MSQSTCVLRRLGLPRAETAGAGPQSAGMGVHGLELAEFPLPGQLGGELEVRQVPPLHPALEDPGRAAERVGQRQAFRRSSSSRAFRSRRPCPPWPNRSRARRASWSRW